MANDEPQPEDLEEFTLRVAESRRRGDPWPVMLSLGQQLGALRRTVAEIQMDRRDQGIELFGDERRGIRGKFREIQDNIDETKRLVISTAEKQERTARRTAEELAEKKNAHRRWWTTFYGRFGIAAGAVYAIAQTVLLIVTAVATHH